MASGRWACRGAADRSAGQLGRAASRFSAAPGGRQDGRRRAGTLPAAKSRIAAAAAGTVTEAGRERFVSAAHARRTLRDPSSAPMGWSAGDQACDLSPACAPGRSRGAVRASGRTAARTIVLPGDGSRASCSPAERRRSSCGQRRREGRESVLPASPPAARKTVRSPAWRARPRRAPAPERPRRAAPRGDTAARRERPPRSEPRAQSVAEAGSARPRGRQRHDRARRGGEEASRSVIRRASGAGSGP